MDVKCPKCGRWLAEGSGFVRAICRDCKIEVTARMKVPA